MSSKNTLWQSGRIVRLDGKGGYELIATVPSPELGPAGITVGMEFGRDGALYVAYMWNYSEAEEADSFHMACGNSKDLYTGVYRVDVHTGTVTLSAGSVRGAPSAPGTLAPVRICPGVMASRTDRAPGQAETIAIAPAESDYKEIANSRKVGQSRTGVQASPQVSVATGVTCSRPAGTSSRALSRVSMLGILDTIATTSRARFNADRFQEAFSSVSTLRS